MTIGEIIKVDPKLVTVQLTTGDITHFIPTHKSVTHGHDFKVGDRVSIRWSRDNSRIASVVLA